MIHFDTNVLVDAANEDSPFHLVCRSALRQTLRASGPTFLTWSVCYEFLRVVTHPAALRSPWSAEKASRFLADLVALPSFEILVATSRHGSVLEHTLAEMSALRGSVMHDLRTAVLMREHGISRICTRDRDFARFSFLTVVDPRPGSDWLPLAPWLRHGRNSSRRRCRSKRSTRPEPARGPSGTGTGPRSNGGGHGNRPWWRALHSCQLVGDPGSCITDRATVPRVAGAAVPT